MKPGPDRTVRPEKPQTVHLCGSFSLKNRSIWKKQGPVRTAIWPHGSENRDQTASHGSLLPFESEPKRKKKKKPTKTSFKFCFLQSKSRSSLQSTYTLIAIVEGWSFNHHEMLSDLRSHHHLPILLLCSARTPSLCFWQCLFFIFPSGVFFCFW